MEVGNWIIDGKILGLNGTLSMTIAEYVPLAREIIKKNPYQRKKVKEHGKVYELLKKDLRAGCIIPPIVLAVTEERGNSIQEIVSQIIANRNSLLTFETILAEFVRKSIDDNEILILDGLQRTLTILQLADEVASSGGPSPFLQNPMRFEIYVGLSKSGLLYRMLTLNTGQTPMSFRHQIEILYNDYINPGSLPNNIRLTTESEADRVRSHGTYRFNDAIDMFYAFTTGSPESMNRQSVVQELREMDFLEGFRTGGDDFRRLLDIYHYFVSKVNELIPDWAASEDKESELYIERPFGKNVFSVFVKVQCMTAFGAECKRLMKKHIIEDIDELRPLIDRLYLEESKGSETMHRLLLIMDNISKTAKKIGDAQREYLQLVFRCLFTETFESYLDFGSCWLVAEEKYGSMFDNS